MWLVPHCWWKKLKKLKNADSLLKYLFNQIHFKLKNDILILLLKQELNAQNQSLTYMLENVSLHFNESFYPFCINCDSPSFKLLYHQDALKRRPARFFFLLPATVWKNLKLSKMLSCGAQFMVAFIFIFMILISFLIFFYLIKRLHLNLLYFTESL